MISEVPLGDDDAPTRNGKGPRGLLEGRRRVRRIETWHQIRRAHLRGAAREVAAAGRLSSVARRPRR